MWYKIKKIFLWEDLVRPKADPVTETWIYHNADLWLLSAVYIVDSWWTIDPNNVHTFSDKNLWATTVWNYWDTPTAANTWTFYQWWNNYGFLYNNAANTATSTSLVDTTNYWPNNYYSSSTFIINWANDWTSDHNRNLWWWTTSGTDYLVSRKWPCETWWHVPAAAELTTLTNMWQTLWWWWSSSDWISISKALLLPNFSWRYSRNTSTWNLEFDTTAPCVYWCCDDWVLYQSAAYWLWVGNNWILYYGYAKAIWYSIRPMRNTPVVPNSSWTKIWPNS